MKLFKILAMAAFMTALVACGDSPAERNETAENPKSFDEAQGKPEPKKEEPKEETAPAKTEEVFVTITGMG